MKIYKIYSLLLAISLVLGACEDINENLVVKRGAATIPTITDISSSFYDLYNLENSFVEFTVDLNEDDEASEIIVEASYNGQKEQIEVFKGTTFPASILLPTDEVTSKLGISMSSLELGDVFTFEVLITSKGVKTRSKVLINAGVACESDLTGTYQCVANGQSTDSGPPADVNPAVNYTTTLTLTEGAVNGEYTMSDFSGGLFTLWYSIYGLSGNYPGKLKDVCGDLSYIGTKGPFGSPISGTGSVNVEDGVITISGLADSWGDAWTLVLTPQ